MLIVEAVDLKVGVLAVLNVPPVTLNKFAVPVSVIVPFPLIVVVPPDTVNVPAVLVSVFPFVFIVRFLFIVKLSVSDVLFNAVTVPFALHVDTALDSVL